MTADYEKPDRPKLLTDEDVERIDLAALPEAREDEPPVVMLGPCADPPYEPGPPRRLPKELRHLGHLKLIE